MLLEFAYTYGNTVWKDLLTAYDGTAITYDTIGNPLSYRDGMTFAWQNGRELASFTQNGQTATYTYNDNGIRTSKTVNGHTINMVLSGNAIVRESPRDGITLTYLYDESGHLYGVMRAQSNGTFFYYYLYNAQGDVIGLVNDNGALVAQYEYDAWGKVLKVTDGVGTMQSASTIMGHVHFN